MTSTAAPSRILIVDDHPMVREALNMRLSMEEDLEICGQAESQDDALRQAEATKPDLVMVDISLKQGNGLSLIKQLTAGPSKTRVIVFTTHPESLYAERALRAGAMGYLNKQVPAEQVTAAIRAVLDGKRYLSPEATERMLDLALGDSATDESPVQSLSDRELEVFRLIGEGQTTSKAAERLGISVHTVDTYREKIKRKLGVKNAVELQREAVRWVIEQTQV